MSDLTSIPERLAANPAPGAAGRPIHWRQQVFLLRRGIAAVRYARQIPIATLEEAFPGVGGLTVEMTYQYETRGLPHGLAYIISCVTAYLAPKRIFELGTGAGGGTLLMARQAPDATIDTLDLGEESSSLGTLRGDLPLETEAVGRVYAGTPESAQITQHLGDSASFDFSPFRGQMDLVLVDGAHTYDYVMTDSRSAFSMVAPGGVILWDDCHLYHPGVSRALAELRAQGHPIVRFDAARMAFMRTAPESRR